MKHWRNISQKIKIIKSKCPQFLNENKWVILLFILSTIFFIYQKGFGLSWDFSSYILNSRYWFSNGIYFEPFRPPLMPLIIGFFSFFGWKLSEYLYIIFVSLLFMISTLKLSESLKFNKNIFYLLRLNPYLLLNVMINFKKILKNFVIFSIPFLLWFVYNHVRFNNFFMGLADSYANNIYFRDYINQGVNYSHIIQVINFLMPLFLVGLVFTFYKILNSAIRIKGFCNLKNFFKENRTEILIILILIISLYGYIKIPIKSSRYLFNMFIPVVYFSMVTLNLIKLKRVNFKRIVTTIIMIITLFSIFQSFDYSSYKKEVFYLESLKKIDELGNNCSIKSNAWVLLNYVGRDTGIFPRKELVPHYIKQGHYIVLFYHIDEPYYVSNKTFLSQFPVIEKNEDFIILGNKNSCAKIEELDRTYINILNETIYLIRNDSTETNPCNIIFSNKFTRMICDKINLK